MTFTQLRAFALVAELGSLRAAAAALGVSEPAVSAAVPALRADLRGPLFRRTGTRHRSPLGVSEPAVSAAVTALRADLGDPLFRRTGTGIALTPGGRALATRARELVRLADRTPRAAAAATSAGRRRDLPT